MDCYYYKEFKLNNGSLDPSVDCTYVLIMHKSPREKQIFQQVINHKLTTHVVFQYNLGFKNCNKNLKGNWANFDLEHAVKNIFKHALDRGYKRILVLEDDCEFDERIKDPNVIHDLNTFLNKENPSVYNLGTVYRVISPIHILLNSNHKLLLWFTGAHACIYNEKYMKYGIKHEFLLNHADLEPFRHFSKYTYKIPLAYQKLPDTINTKRDHGLDKLTKEIFIKPYNLDKQTQPGYSLMHKVFDCCSINGCLVLIILILLISNLL